jgi:Tol biopolymer transport system component
VKVLDFGLAKAMSGDDTDDDARLGHAPTVTMTGAHGGAILGTAAYMSPEQARGKPVDKRTDVWAFGCVLYEMLTGRAAFSGETLTDTLAAVVDHRPAWDRLPDDLAMPVRRLLERCLEKDPKRRLRDIGDARLELDEPVAPATQASIQSRAALRPIAILVGAAAVATAGFLLGRVDRAFPPAFRVGTVTRLTSDSGLTTAPSLSADGRLVVYASDRGGDRNLDLWVQQVSGGTAVRITTDPGDDHQPSLSPDGSRVAFRAERDGGGVHVMPTLGGEARLIAPRGRGPRFSPDGTQIVYWIGSELGAREDLWGQTFVTSAAGGASRRVAADLATATFSNWSADGSALLVLGRTDARSTLDWWWAPLDGRPVRQTGAYERFRAAGLLTTGLGVDDAPIPETWVDDEVVFSAVEFTGTQNLWAIRLPPRTGRTEGAPRRLTVGPGDDARPAAAGSTLAISRRDKRLQIFGLPLNANEGRALGELGQLRPSFPARGTARATVAANASVLVFPVITPSGSEIRVRDLETGMERILALVRSEQSTNPVISADGAMVGYTAGEQGLTAGYVVGTTGGVPRKICDRCGLFGWLADGRRILMGQEARTAVIDTQSGDRKLVLSDRGGGDGRVDLSPDERWISFRAGEKGIFVAPFRPGVPPPVRDWVKITDVVETDRMAGWSPDSRLVYLLLVRDGFRCLWAERIDPTTGHPQGAVFPVYHFHQSNLQWGSSSFGNAVARGLFVLDLNIVTGNVWVSSIER